MKDFMLQKVAWQSLLYRKGAVVMAIFSVAMSVFVLLGVEHIRQEARNSFTSTVSGVDLIVGPRTGQINLLLYSVFRLGTPTNNISWESAEQITDHPDVAWTIPISLGDSHAGFRVMGTDQNFFSQYQYGQQRPLEFSSGQSFFDEKSAVLGATVASKLGYELNQEVVMAHGIAEQSFTLHDEQPFKVVGILQATGTPVDNALYVSLEGIEAIHSSGGQAEEDDHAEPEQITALMVGLKSKFATFNLQRWVNDYTAEPLLAILPGVVLVELWSMMSVVERSLIVISILIFVAALAGIAAMLLSSMRERKQELVIIRSLGARPSTNYWLLVSEALLIVGIGIVIAVFGLLLAIGIFNVFYSASVGMSYSWRALSLQSVIALAIMIVSVFLICLLPAINAYKVAKA